MGRVRGRVVGQISGLFYKKREMREREIILREKERERERERKFQTYQAEEVAEEDPVDWVPTRSSR